MSKAAKITNWGITDLTPKVDKKYKSELDKLVLKQVKLEFDLEADSAISNTIRRVSAGELYLKHLYTDFEQINTDDEFIIPEMIQERIKMIPVLQTVPDNVKFNISVVNNSLDVEMIFTKDLKASDGRKYFDLCIPLFDLRAGKQFHLGAQVRSSYTWQEGMVCAVSQAVSMPSDVKLTNLFEGEEGDVTTDPKMHRISMISMGMIQNPKDIIKMSCDNIIERLGAVRDIISDITGTNNEYILVINGESDTIGNLLMKEGWVRYPKLNYLTYKTEPDVRQLTIKISHESPKSVLKDVIDYCVDIFTIIKTLL